MHLAQELLRNVQYSGCSRNFAKEIRALKMRSSVASYQKLTNDQLRGSLKLILLKLHKKLLKSSELAILWLFSIWSKLERWKSLVNWVSHKLIKKNLYFEAILCNYNEPHLSWITMCNEKCIVYDNWWWLDWEEAPIHFPKPNLHEKLGVVTVWWSAARLIHYSFLNREKPLHLSKMHLKLHNAYS